MKEKAEQIPAMATRVASTFMSEACCRKCSVARTQSSNGTGYGNSGASR